MKYININRRAVLGKNKKVRLIQLSSQFVFEVPGNQSEGLCVWSHKVYYDKEGSITVPWGKQNFFLALNSKALQNCTVDNTLSDISLANLLHNSYTDDINYIIAHNLRLMLVHMSLYFL